MIPLRRIVNDRGYLLEIQRNDDDHYPGFGQAYITATNPGVIKAWYRHLMQTDQIALAQGSLLLVLYDARENSPTHRRLQEIHLNEKQDQLVKIPTGVWHGFKALGTRPALLLHLNSKPFDFNNPDEERIAIDDSRIPYCWSP